MAPDTPDTGLDDQDQAETFDETNLDDAAEFVTLEEMPDVYDATRALGDSRDLEALDAAEVDPEALGDEDLEDDEDLDDELRDQLEDDEEDDHIDDEDADDEDGVDRLELDEVELAAAGDMDDADEADDESVYEADDLDDDDLEELGYRSPESRAIPARPDGADAHSRQEELLDEGVEETFPASDPVSVKRIT